MRIRIQSARLDHELHNLRVASTRMELVRWLRRTIAILRICIGCIPVDITAIYEAANEDDSPVREGFASWIPAVLLHLKAIGGVVPGTVGVEPQSTVGDLKKAIARDIPEDSKSITLKHRK